MKLCDTTSFPMSMYEDNWVGSNAIKLLRRKPPNQPWFMHVQYSGLIAAGNPTFVAVTHVAASAAACGWLAPGFLPRAPFTFCSANSSRQQRR